MKETKQTAFYVNALKYVDALLQLPEWQSSPYLKALLKRLNSLTEALTQAIDLSNNLQTDRLLDDESHLDDQQSIYVSLYCATGELKDWEKILSNITTQLISRPIFESETAIQSWIRSKKNVKSEAYAVLSLPKSSIIRKANDKTFDGGELGQVLLSVKDPRISEGCWAIRYFVHENQAYHYKNGLLAKLNSESSE